MRTMCNCVEQWVLGQMSSVGSDYEKPRHPRGENLGLVVETFIPF